MRIGIDIGGTKIAAVLLDEDGAEVARQRTGAPRDYEATLGVLGEIASLLEGEGGRAVAVGLSVPGVITARGELRRVVNLPWLEDRPLVADLEANLGRPVSIANDANCFALSEAIDGAASGARVVFGAILGTGVGGGIVVDRRVLAGANALAGEWGHNPLPWRDGAEPAVRCGCGRTGCIETWLNGAALVRDYGSVCGREATVSEIVRLAGAGDPNAGAAVSRYKLRLAKALAAAINFLDPDVIVLGGGLSEISDLYASVPRLWAEYTLVAEPRTGLARARHGPDSGMRGAAWL